MYHGLVYGVVEASQPSTWFSRNLSPQAAYAKPEFKNRWAMTPVAFATHMCIGSPFAWSVMSGTVARDHGFVVSAAT